MDIQVLKFVDNQVNSGNKVALIMLTETKGSTPRKAGSIMAISSDGNVCGSVGGGNLENQILISAKEAIKNNQDAIFEHILTEKGSLDMICGGESSGYIKIFSPKNKLIIIGAGHVGKALYDIASNLDFDITVMDDRAEYANLDFFPNAKILVGRYDEQLSDIKTDKSTYVVIVTRGHKYDELALRALLNKETAYIGMIGSTRKIKSTLDILEKEELYKGTLDKIYAPIGLDIGSNLPSEIALGIMCEIVLHKNVKKPRHMKEVYKEKVEN